jgi:hypothetical protein
VGVFSGPPEAPGPPLALRKLRLRGDTILTLVVDQVPGAAGIDPYHVLIDRERRDNVVAARRP